MKAILFFAVMVFACRFAAGQDVKTTDVPGEVRDAFEGMHPKAAGVSWAVKEKNVYEATFTENGKKQRAEFNKKGKWKEGEVMISPSTLPKMVTEAVSDKYRGYSIKESEEVEHKNGAKTYELDLETNRKTCQVKFTQQGDQIGKTECALAE